MSVTQSLTLIIDSYSACHRQNASKDSGSAPVFGSPLAGLEWDSSDSQEGLCASG